MMTETIKTKRRYNRYSRIYNLLEYPFEKLFFAKWRKKAFLNLHGKILEIGVGTGKNLKYFPKKEKITGIDLSEGMLQKAKQEAKRIRHSLNLIQMDAQKLKFKNNTFDAIAGTFVLCSIPNPVKALKEMKRVLKKNGKIVMIEHVLSKNKIIAFWQNIHNPLTKIIFGFNVNRDTKKNILKARLKLKSDTKIALKDVFRKFECSKGDEDR